MRNMGIVGVAWFALVALGCGTPAPGPDAGRVDSGPVDAWVDPCTDRAINAYISAQCDEDRCGSWCSDCGYRTCDDCRGAAEAEYRLANDCIPE